MGWHIGVTGIKTHDSEKLLDTTNKYYQKFGLSVVEERIGKKSGKYIQSPRSYSNLKEYDNYNSSLTYAKEIYFTTNFDLYDNLEENNNWLAFLYNPRSASHTLNINSDFSSFLSKELDTDVIEYFVYDVPAQAIIRFHNKGWITDQLSTADLEIYDAEGYFEDYRNKIVDTYPDIVNIIKPYLQKIGFNPVSSEFTPSNKRARRPMYLKGKPEDINNFLLYKQQVF